MLRRAAVLVAFAFLAQPAFGQLRILGLVPDEHNVHSLWEGRVDGVAVRELTMRARVTGAVREGPQFAGGGRFVTWIAQDTVSGAWVFVAFDRRSGVLARVTDVRALGVADRAHPRVFVRTGSAIVRVSPSGVEPLPDTGSLAAVGISQDGARLYTAPLLPSGAISASRLDVLDSETGARLRSIALGANGPVSPFRGSRHPI
jgi:hypothetical protein